MKLPKRLGKQPLIDATFEVRFNPTDQPLADLLPGIVYSKLGDEYKRSEVLPIASFPRELRDKDFKYAAFHRLHGENVVVFFGDRVIGVSRLAPYAGWSAFRPRIEAVIDVIEASALIGKLERFSLKAINVIPHEGRGLNRLKLDARLAGTELPDRGFRLRTELNDERFVRIIEIVTNVSGSTARGAVFKGLQVSVDTIRNLDGKGGWNDVREGLDEVHDEGKRTFFGMLTDETLSDLEPEYD